MPLGMIRETSQTQISTRSALVIRYVDCTVVCTESEAHNPSAYILRRVRGCFCQTPYANPIPTQTIAVN